jgi:hypothetical protein
MSKVILASFSLLALPMASAQAQSNSFDRVMNFQFGDTIWQARSLIVGQTSTLTVAAGGDPRYLPARPARNGLAFLSLDTSGGGASCTGSLMAGGTAILTAAHCVTDGSGKIIATGGAAYFYGGPADPLYDLDFGTVPGIERVALGAIHVAPGYTGEVIDHNDLAIIFLDGTAPAFATPYRLADVSDPTGRKFAVAGFGDRGRSGATGAIEGSFGRLREGLNRFDFALGNPLFGTGWADVLGAPFSQISDSWLADFDRSGFAANDAACIATASLFGISKTFCNAGLGRREVGMAGGDSGGPQFFRNRIVAVTSYGLTAGTALGDVDDALNSSWGEFNGFAPVFRNREWINQLVPGAFGTAPEPATWAMLIAGFGLVGIAARRRRAIPARTA